MNWIQRIFCFPTVVSIARDQDELKRIIADLSDARISTKVETGTNRDIVCSNGKPVFKVKVCAVNYAAAKTILQRKHSFSM